jgi:hypothetical protein
VLHPDEQVLVRISAVLKYTIIFRHGPGTASHVNKKDPFHPGFAAQFVEFVCYWPNFCQSCHAANHLL